MGEIGAGDEGDPAAARRDGLGEGVEKPWNARVVVRTLSLLHRLVGEARQHRDDPDLAVRVEVTEEDGLEFDRVLDAVGELGPEAVLTRALRQRLHEVAVHGDVSERARVVLPGERERVLHSGVAGAEHHEHVGLAPLGQIAIRPCVGGTTAVEVDVWRDHGPHLGPADPAAVDRARPGRRREESIDHRSELFGVGRVRRAGVGGRTGRGREKAVVDGGATFGEARTVEESLLIQSLGDLLELSPLNEPPVTAHHRRLDVGDRVLAVEERHDVEEGSVQQDDRRRVAGGIAQGHTLPALVLDGKGFDPAQAGRGLAHAWRKFRADAA